MDPLLKNLRLFEANIPGSSLGQFSNGKQREPIHLTVAELKRWLACRGARRSGNKPELVERSVAPFNK